MGLQINSDEKGVKVIRKDGTSKVGNAYTMYSLMYSFKQGDDWKNVFIECSFRRGVDLANKTLQLTEVELHHDTQLRDGD